MTPFDGPEEDGSPGNVVQLEMAPKILEFHATESSLLTTKLLHAKRHDGRPAFNFMDLKLLWMYLIDFEDEQNLRHLLRNAGLLEKLCLSVDSRSLVGLHDNISESPSAPTLKVLELSANLYSSGLPLAGICEELEAMAGHYTLEALSIEVIVDDDDATEDSVGSIFQKVGNVLVKPGWSSLRRVSFEILLNPDCNLYEALQSLPDKYLSHLLKLESVTFNYSAYNVVYDPTSSLFL